MNRFVLPIAIFAALVALLAVGLTLDPRKVPSPLIGKPAPHFELPLLQEAKQTFTERDMLGKVWVLNVWASWCVTCREEHPVPLAEDLRNQVREKMRRGASDSEIVDYLVARYGDFVLYRPPFKLTTVLLWFGPLLLLAAGFIVLLRRVLRRRPAQDLEMTASERVRAAELLAGNEAERR